jgi:hypothetical protein
MAGSGFFLGGAAEGMMGAKKQALAEQTLAQDTGLRTRALELQERQFGRQISQDAQTQADKLISDTMGVISETIKNGIEGGADPAKIRQTVQPLLDSVTPIAARSGRNPAALAAQIDAQLTAPGPIEKARVAGRAEGTHTVEEERAIQQQPEGTRVEISPWKTPKEKVEAEGKLRDDYIANSRRFVTVRDFYDRMKSAPGKGAGDLTLVFSYMKVLDPESAVRSDERADVNNAGGVPEAVRALYNRVLGGGLLTETIRKDIKAEGDRIWSDALNRHSSLTTQFTNIAKRNKLNPQNVIVDLTAGSEGPPGLSGVTPNGIRWNFRGEPWRGPVD